MSAVVPPVAPTVARTVRTAPVSRSSRHYYTWVALGVILITFVGFARTYYLKTFFHTEPLPLLLQFHGLVLTAWLLLFLVQVRLVAAHRVALHRRLGVFGVVLALLVYWVSLFVTIHATRRDAPRDPGAIPFFALTFTNLLLFAALVLAAILYRRRAGIHKRLMVLAMCSLIGPGLTRLPFSFIQNASIPTLLGLLEVCMLLCVAYDTLKNRRLHPAFAWGGLLFLLWAPSAVFLGGTHAWARFAQLLIR